MHGLDWKRKANLSILCSISFLSLAWVSQGLGFPWSYLLGFPPRVKASLDPVGRLRALALWGLLDWQLRNSWDFICRSTSEGPLQAAFSHKQVKPNVFSSRLDRIYWPELLWTNYPRLLYTPSSIHAILGNSVLCLGDSEGMTLHNKGRAGCSVLFLATNFGESFISRVGASESEKHRTWLEGEFITLPTRVNKTEELSITVGSGTTLAANICSTGWVLTTEREEHADGF